MNTVELIGQKIDPCNLDVKAHPAQSFGGQCCVTANVVQDCYLRSKLIGDGFTNLDLLAAPNSPLISAEAWRTIGYKWERMACWYVNDEEYKVKIDKPFMRQIVLHGSQKMPWAMYLTTSYKKHGSLNAPINFTPFGCIRFENLTVDCRNRDQIWEYWNRMNEVLNAGFSITSVVTLDPMAGEIKNRWKAWENYYAWAVDKYRNSLYALMVYLMPSLAERKEVRANDALDAVKIGG